MPDQDNFNCCLKTLSFIFIISPQKEPVTCLAGFFSSALSPPGSAVVVSAFRFTPCFFLIGGWEGKAFKFDFVCCFSVNLNLSEVRPLSWNCPGG